MFKNRFDLINIFLHSQTLKTGCCIIINQKNYKDPKGIFKTRTGSDFDKAELISVWKRFGCETPKIFEDLTGDELKKTFQEISKQDFSKFDFLIVAILSHGERKNGIDYVVGKDGKSEVSFSLAYTVHHQFRHSPYSL